MQLRINLETNMGSRSGLSSKMPTVNILDNSASYGVGVEMGKIWEEIKRFLLFHTVKKGQNKICR